MEVFESQNTPHLFNALSGLKPNTPNDYNRIVKQALYDIADVFDIVKVEYSSILSIQVLYDHYPFLKKNVIFKAEKDNSGRVLKYKSTFPMNSIDFVVTINKDRELTKTEEYSLQLIFNHLTSTLNTVILRASCEMIYLTDQHMKIYNKEGLFKFIETLMSNGEMDKYTAIYFNIHNFKSVYLSVNYLEASDVLTRYCNVITNAITSREIVALMGGDNFVALILDKHKDYFLDLIQNMIVKYEKSGNKMTFSFGATIGVAKVTAGSHPAEIMMHISQAYQAARETRVSLCYYDQKTSSKLIEDKNILSLYGKALANHDFFALYQPKVDANTQRLIGAEALVRWKNGDTFMMPGNFIPVLENDGCITSLDFYMLEEVCKFLCKLRNEKIELVKISVNFSKRHLSNNRLVEEIAEVIDRYNIPHQYIEIELTESENAENQVAMKNIVDKLSSLGIMTSIDDFGTGYSSLSMLKTLQVEELKIDRSFIPKDDSADSDKTLYLLKGVTSLAKNLGLTIVAEGVETPRQLELIKGMQCDIVQGYIFDKPLSEADFIERIKQKVYILDQE